MGRRAGSASPAPLGPRANRSSKATTSSGEAPASAEDNTSHGTDPKVGAAGVPVDVDAGAAGAACACIPVCPASNAPQGSWRPGASLNPHKRLITCQIAVPRSVGPSTAHGVHLVGCAAQARNGCGRQWKRMTLLSLAGTPQPGSCWLQWGWWVLHTLQQARRRAAHGRTAHICTGGIRALHAAAQGLNCEPAILGAPVTHLGAAGIAPPPPSARGNMAYKVLQHLAPNKDL